MLYPYFSTTYVTSIHIPCNPWQNCVSLHWTRSHINIGGAGLLSYNEHHSRGDEETQSSDGKENVPLCCFKLCSLGTVPSIGLNGYGWWMDGWRYSSPPQTPLIQFWWYPWRPHPTIYMAVRIYFSLSLRDTPGKSLFWWFNGERT